MSAPRALPSPIRVGPMNYTVRRDPLLHDAVGETKPESLTIRIRPGQAEDYEADTLLHELIHAILAHAPIELAEGVEEQLCLHLAPNLLDTLRRNPRLRAFLLPHA